jgi:hypothetical protein
MKRENKFLLAIGLALWTGVDWGLAQTNVGPTLSEGTRIGKVISSPTAPLASDALAPVNRPKVAERPELSAEVQERINRFRRDAQLYLDRQQALKKQLAGANDLERARIREQMENLRLKWVERSRELREEFRDRAVELRDKLRDYAPVIDSAKETLRDGHNNRGRD